MCFGLNNAGATFLRTMQEVLRGLQWQWLLIYLDDVIIFSSSFEEHLSHLSQVFDRFGEANLRLKPSKCTLARKRVQYLGHVLSESGIETDSSKTDILKNYPTPRTQKEVRALLGLTGYCRKYIENYGVKARPLFRLLCKGVRFCWSGDCQIAFELLINA
jgi:hypothetical protein